MEPVIGSCLCGGVRFELTQPFRRASHCHCSRCRKHSGAFGLTQGRVPQDGFRLLEGEELIRALRRIAFDQERHQGPDKRQGQQ